jgi:hypothetical protein
MARQPRATTGQPRSCLPRSTRANFLYDFKGGPIGPPARRLARAGRCRCRSAAGALTPSAGAGSQESRHRRRGLRRRGGAAIAVRTYARGVVDVGPAVGGRRLVVRCGYCASAGGRSGPGTARSAPAGPGSWWLGCRPARRRPGRSRADPRPGRQPPFWCQGPLDVAARAGARSHGGRVDGARDDGWLLCVCAPPAGGRRRGPAVVESAASAVRSGACGQRFVDEGLDPLADVVTGPSGRSRCVARRVLGLDGGVLACAAASPARRVQVLKLLAAASTSSHVKSRSASGMTLLAR